MHEMSVATALVKEVLANLREYEIERVEEVILQVGELAFINEMQLEFCYDMLSKEHDILADSELKIVREKAKVRCPDCGHVGGLDSVEEPEDHTKFMSFACPECGETMEIDRGRGMLLKNISAQVKED